VLAICLATAFTTLLDQAVLNVAVPALRALLRVVGWSGEPSRRRGTAEGCITDDRLLFRGRDAMIRGLSREAPGAVVVPGHDVP
jgi:hypothetical protein